MRRRYHRVRVEVACALLSSSLRKAFGDGGRSPQTVVELGAGSGIISEQLSSLGYDVIATDLEKDALRVAAARGLRCECVDVTRRFPWGDGSIHGILAGELIEHLFDVAHFLSECRRVLKKRGILVLTTPNLAGFEDRVRFLFGKSPRQIDAFHEYLKLHIRPFTPSALRAALEKYGFTLIAIRSNFVRFDSFGLAWKVRWLARLMPELGGTLIVAAEQAG